MTDTPRRTALYDDHLALGGRMVTFAGWELPVQYDSTGPTVEHQAVRTAAGVFDIDHMGQFVVSGAEAESFLNAVQTVDVRKLQVGDAHYSLLPYADGGLVDDIFLYRLEDAWWVVVNAGNRGKDLRWLEAHRVGFNADLRDISDETYMLAIQGPKAQAILQTLTDIDLAQVRFHSCAWGQVAGARTLIGATGYTGEYGYELFFPSHRAAEVWNALLVAGRPHGMLPCGLAARDSLRFEAALPLYGHEINAETTPFTAGLGSFVHFDKGDFVGRDALLKVKLEGPAEKLVGFEMVDKAVPREGYPVVAGERTIGHVTTGMHSPTDGRFLGMAIVPAEFAKLGSEFSVVVRESPKRAVVIKRPFYIPAYRRNG